VFLVVSGLVLGTRICDVTKQYWLSRTRSLA
jgi:hypothetical protein